MPLVVPGLMSKDGGDKTNDWMNKLMGKKIGDSSNEVVSPRPNLPPPYALDPSPQRRQGENRRRKELTPSTDLRKERSTRRTSCNQEWRNVNHGSQT